MSLSQHTVKPRGFVQREMAIALDMLQRHEEEPLDLALRRLRQQHGFQSFILPVRLDPVKPPEPLNDFQWIDYFSLDGPQQLTALISKLIGVKQVERGV